MVNLETRNDLEPICPHRSAEVRTVWMSELRSTLGRRYIYFCPNCRKVPGISHRKGLWMG